MSPPSEPSSYQLHVTNNSSFSRNKHNLKPSIPSFFSVLLLLSYLIFYCCLLSTEHDKLKKGIS